jgi:hypothetical protein
VRLVFAVALLGACSSSTISERSPCITLCQKLNSCRRAMNAAPISCGACSYGGDLLPGLGPAPSCPALAAQQTCVEAAVTRSCDEYIGAALACPQCPVLDGSACTSDADCQQYRRDYRCDLGRPGGYCTRACTDPDQCSTVGPEICTGGKPPSFAPQASPTDSFCLLGCRSDAECRTADGYACLFSASLSHGLCDVR